MIIDTCILGCNLNPNYYQYYPLCRLVWKELCGIQTKLVLIGDHIPAYLQPYEDEIFLIPPFNGLHDVYLSQIMREYFPCLFPDAKGIIMSDADMLPMSRRYFLDSVKDIPQDKLVVYRDGVINDHKEIPMCYIAGSCKAWRSVFKCETLDDIKAEVTRIAQPHTFDGKHGGKGWMVDQWNLYSRLEEHEPKDEIVRLTDRITNFHRMDRDFTINQQVIHAQFYCDYHMPRWLPTNYETVKRVIECLLPGVEVPRLTF
jgi:hypothetical protein